MEKINFYFVKFQITAQTSRNEEEKLEMIGNQLICENNLKSEFFLINQRLEDRTNENIQQEVTSNKILKI
jgi:hypothetical protein